MRPSFCTFDRLRTTRGVFLASDIPVVGAYPDALVWGPCGFIGQPLVARLLASGARVSVLSHPRSRYATPAWADQVRWFEIDAAQDPVDTMRRAIDTASVVFNLAGSTGAVQSNREPMRSLDENNRVQLQFLDACARSASRPHVVFTSSRLVYRRNADAAVAEDHPLEPVSVYAAHKLCCEHYHRIVADQGVITSTIARISIVYGADLASDRRLHGFLNAIVHKALAGLPITVFGSGRQQRDYLYIRDLLEALLLCGRHPLARNETLNIGSGRGIALEDAVKLVVKLGGAVPIRHIPWPAEYELAESGDYVADTSRIQRLLGFAPRYSFEDGMAETIRLARAHATEEPRSQSVPA